MPWIFRIHFSDDMNAKEECESEKDCAERAKLAMDHGYLKIEEDIKIYYPSQSILKFEYFEE